MAFWNWLRDFADRRMGDNKESAREDPKPPPPSPRVPPSPPPVPSLEDLMGGWAPYFTRTMEVTKTCATCGQKNRIDMAKPGQVRCGKCGLPLRVTVKVTR